MRKYLYAIAGLVVLALGAAVVAPGFIDWDQHKPRIQKAIADATGYDVSFGGKIQLAVLPFPHVSIENLAIKVPKEQAGVEDMNVITLKKAEVSIALAPLFRGEVSVRSVNLVEPSIRLEVARDGRKLWMTDVLTKAQGGAQGAEAPGAAPKTASAGKFALEKLQIENGTIAYSDAAKGTKQSFENVNLTFSADSLNGPFVGKGALVWNKQKMDIDLKTGRIDQGTKTISAQAAIKLPASGASLTYSGVVGTAGVLDLQGETALETGNLSATLTNLSGKASSLPPLPFKVQGLMTAKPQQADVKNMKLTLGDVEATGALGVTNMGVKDAPMQITTALQSPSILKLESLMPVKSVKTVKAAANNDAPKVGGVKSFLPETMQLPVPVDIKADLALAGMSYKGTEYGDVKIALNKKGSQIDISEKIGQMPGGGTLDATTNLGFASGSQGAEKAGVVYSDPTLQFSMRGDARAPGKFLSAFLPETTIKSMQPLFKDPITLSAKGSVHASRVAVESGAVSLGKTALNLGASSYTLDPAGRDDVALSISGQDINLDHFTGKKVEAEPEDKVQTPVTPAKPAAQAMQESLKKLSLPVDLTLKAALKNVTMQGVTYGALDIDGSLKGGMLDLKTASLTDPQGNVMRASGTVKDLPGLGGVDVTLGGKTSDGAAFLSSFKIDTKKLPKDFGPLDLSVSLTGEKSDALAFNANAKALGGEGQANGMLLNALAAKPAVDKLSLRVTHPNFEQLAQKFNPGYKAGVGIRKDMDVYANINMEAGGYSLSGLKAAIGGMDLTGTVKANTSGAKPDITANLQAGTIPLDILSGKNKTAKTTGNSPATSKVTASGENVRWSRNAINTAWMQGFNLDLKVSAKAVEYGNWVLNDTVLGATLKDGALDIGQMDAKVYGGTMALTANLKSTGKERDPLSFAVKSNFKDVALEPLAASFSGAKVIKARGNVSLDLDASSTGISPAALISGLAGKGNVNGRNVVVQGFDLAAMSRSLVSTNKVFDNISGLAGAAFSGGETAFEKIEGPFTIAEGVVKFDNLQMTGPTANIANKGTISLPRWYIDMNSTIDLAQPEDAPNLDVRFQGPLDNPGNTFAGQAMESYINTRVNQKLQKVIGEKLGDKNPELNTLLNSVLGGGKAPAPAPAPAPVQAAPATPTPAPAPTPTPTPQQQQAAPVQEQQIAPSSGDAAPAAPQPQEPAPAPTPAPAEKQLSPEEQIMKGVLEGILKQ